MTGDIEMIGIMRFANRVTWRRTLTLGIAGLVAACSGADRVESDVSDFAAASQTAPPPPSSTLGLTLSVHTTLGIPEAATVGDPQHYLLVRPQYVTSFDSQRKNPRWTSWELTTAWLGSAARSPAFLPDGMLPASVPQATDADYRSSGFERGHLCPSADRTDAVPDNGATPASTGSD